jgi:hypothetical protein
MVLDALFSSGERARLIGCRRLLKALRGADVFLKVGFMPAYLLFAANACLHESRVNLVKGEPLPRWRKTGHCTCTDI